MKVYQIVKQWTKGEYQSPTNYITEIITDQDIYKEEYGNPLLPLYKDKRVAEEKLELLQKVYYGRLKIITMEVVE